MDSSVLVRKSGFSGLTFLSALPRSSLKVRDEYKNKKFHFIAGGGRASPYMMALADSGIKYGISPVNEGDSDWSLAKDLGLELIEMPSFSSVSAPVLEQEKTALETSDIVVFPSVPIGAANTSVLDMVEYAQKINKQIWIETGLDFNLRNYSGRESAERFESILKNSKTIKYKNLAGFLEILCSYES
jgi:iron complex transport system ATP-binding protein